MLQRLRFSIVLLLMVLQIAAPLVHAHVGVDAGRQAGLHMHELEVFNLAQSLDTSAVYAQLAQADESLVIDLDSAINPGPHLQDIPVLLFYPGWLTTSIEHVVTQIACPRSDFLQFPVSPHLDQRSPRAPPHPV